VGTVKKISNLFKKVYTIEKSEVMFYIAKENLKDIPNYYDKIRYERAFSSDFK